MAGSAFAPGAPGGGQSEIMLERCSIERGWQGLRLEIGQNEGCETQALRVPGYLVGMQITGKPIAVEVHRNGEWIPTIIPSHRLFIHPTGTPLSIRHDTWTRWAIAIVDHPLLRAIPHADMLGGLHNHDEQVSQVFQALVEQLAGDPTDQIVDRATAQSLIQSLILALHLKNKGIASFPIRGGITPRMRLRLTEWVKANIDQALSVSDMAELLGYSPSHFAREFKRSIGKTPHAYVTDIRLLTALELSGQGMSLGTAAHECGFADQAHFSNAFRRRYGVSPSRWLKASEAARRKAAN